MHVLSSAQQGPLKDGDVVFRDEVVVFRVLTGRTRAARRFFKQLKKQLMIELRQEAILIVEKEAEAL